MSDLLKNSFLTLVLLAVAGGLSGCWLAAGEGGPAESTSGSTSAGTDEAKDSEDKSDDHSSKGEGEGEKSEKEESGKGEEHHSGSGEKDGDDKAGHDHKDEEHPEGEEGEHDKSEGGHHGHIGEPAEEPDLLGDPRYDMAFYSLAVFVLLLLALTKFAWGPIVESIDAREEGIRKNIEEAELARQRAEELLAEHAKKLDSVQDEVREIIAEARRDADHTKNDIIAKAQAEAEAERTRAIDEIKRAKDQSLKEIFDTAADQVAIATETVIGRTLSDDDRGRLIEESLSQFAGQVGENN